MIPLFKRATPIMLLLRFLSCDPVYAQLLVNDRMYYTVNGTTPGPTSNFVAVQIPASTIATQVFVGQTTWLKARLFRPSTGEWGRVDSHRVVVDVALPIQLLYFQGQHLAEGNVMLEWYTVSETQNYGFMIVRNGRVQPILIQGHGTTNEPHRYNFIDHIGMFTPRSMSYRLLQIDLDGTQWQSPNIFVSTTP